jgi:RNA polymerase sigma-32 factor
MTSRTRTHFDLRRCVPMTSDEEHLCATEYAKTKSPHLAARLIQANMRLVVQIAQGYRRPQYDVADLIQEGNLGLVQAVIRYDPTRGARLTTYAAWWIRAYILKFTLENWRLVQAGTSQVQRKLFFNLGKQRDALERRGIGADSHNLAAVLEVKEKDVSFMMERFAAAEASLDAPSGLPGRESWSLADTLGGAPTLQPDVRLEAADFGQQLRGRLKVIEETLAGRELAIFHRRLLCDEPETLAELAVDFGVSAERTRQIEQGLKGRIRLDLTKGLGDALDVGRIDPPRRFRERTVQFPTSLCA